MEKFTYKIIDANPVQNYVVVEYTPETAGLSTLTYNVSVPDIIADLNTNIFNASPQVIWERERNPRNDIINLIGQTASINNVSIATVNIEYESMQMMHNEFLAEQSNTASV